MRDAIQRQAEISAADKNDAAIDVEQLKTELQRSKPEKSRVWALVERLNGIAGLLEKVTKLAPLLHQLGLG